MAKKAIRTVRKSKTARHNLKRLSKQQEDHLFGVDKFASIADDVSPVSGFIKSESAYEEIVHPRHYNHLPNGVECIDVIEHFPANLANSMKYIWRAGHKPGNNIIKDIDKAIWYLQRQKNLLQNNVPSMVG